MDAYVTTNATLLGDRIDEIARCGLRWLTNRLLRRRPGLHSYTQREGHFDKLQRSLATVRSRCGDAIAMQMNYMLSRRSCHVRRRARGMEARRAVRPAPRGRPRKPARSRSSECPETRLSIPPKLRPELLAVAAEFERLKTLRPDRVVAVAHVLRMLPALLLEDAASRIPCDAYERCGSAPTARCSCADVAFPLGSLKEKRLRDILFTERALPGRARWLRAEVPDLACARSTAAFAATLRA
jgi:hypothetical protein